MSKKVVLFSAVFLLALNIVCWQEVFVLLGPRFLLVDFLDVGQGDSAFIQTPENHQILVDGGPNPTVLGKLSLLMPLWDKDIDLVILTHPELDHMQGLLEVFKRYKADYILWSGVKRNTPEYKEWLSALDRQRSLGAKIIIAESGQKVKAGDLEIDTIYPFENLEGKELKNTSNDTCVVSRISFGKKSFLFTGDIAISTENKIIDSGKIINSDVLKISHHGSKYSTSDLFLQLVSPEIAVISVGAKNTYGHPTPEVLNRLEKFGITTLRTDRDGDIKLVSDGNNIKIVK